MNERELDKDGQIGVCSWSLRAASPADLVGKVLATGCRAVQLALEPIRCGDWDEVETFERLGEAGICVLSGMMEMAGEDYSSIGSIAQTGGVRPDSTWPTNEAAGRQIAEIAARRGIGLVTFHAGFIPHGEGDSIRTVMLIRLGILAAVFGQAGVRMGFETGQESVRSLEAVLDELECFDIGVNFDPANLILYGSGEPVEALRRLAPRVVQVHIKDARPSVVADEWGEEVVVGTGAVDWDGVFEILRSKRPGVDLLVEREAGDSRVADIRVARGFVESNFARGSSH